MRNSAVIPQIPSFVQSASAFIITRYCMFVKGFLQDIEYFFCFSFFFLKGERFLDREQIVFGREKSAQPVSQAAHYILC